MDTKKEREEPIGVGGRQFTAIRGLPVENPTPPAKVLIFCLHFVLFVTFVVSILNCLARKQDATTA